MKKTIMPAVICVAMYTFGTWGWAGTLISYSYDAQHRLVGVDYTQVQPDTQVSYQYDEADNIKAVVSITDGQYLKSFLLWLARIIPDRFEPPWLRT